MARVALYVRLFSVRMCTVNAGALADGDIDIAGSAETSGRLCWRAR
jgi:hypothetical protein